MNLVKSSHGPYGGSYLRFLSLQPDTSGETSVAGLVDPSKY